MTSFYPHVQLIQQSSARINYIIGCRSDDEQRLYNERHAIIAVRDAQSKNTS